MLAVRHQYVRCPLLGQQLTVIANVLRYNVIEKLNLGDFQLSQNYLFFYDKLEKANYYLEYVHTIVRADSQEHA